MNERTESQANHLAKVADRLMNEGNFKESIVQCNRALELDKNCYLALNITGVVHLRQGQAKKALSFFDQALKKKPSSGLVALNMAAAHRDMGNLNKAIGIAQCILRASPNSLHIIEFIGHCFVSMNRYLDAAKCFEKVAELDPNKVSAYEWLSACLLRASKFIATRNACQSAIKRGFNSPAIYNNLGAASMGMTLLDDAIDAFLKANELDPNNRSVISNLAGIIAHSCDWEKCAKYETAALSRALASIEENGDFTIRPFTALTIDTDATSQKHIAEQFVKIRLSHTKPQIEGISKRRFSKEKIVLGYLSSDVRDHPVFHLANNLFKHHDREQFEVICYSNGHNDQSAYRQHAIDTCDKFVDISNSITSKSIELIKADQVDILIDMNGHTICDRLDIMSCRPAPIQIHFLGYPGTIGASFIDYFVTDHYLTPPGSEAHFTEKLIFMPDTYQISDDEQEPANTPVSRSDEGLPDNKFVFCSLNSSYKIEPKIFGAWTTILKEVPNSVLWLMTASTRAMNNLKAAAERYGVEPERLIFAKRTEKSKHLARHTLADLFLDTHIVCGHTTANDALQMGLPVLACPRENFISRVSSTLLRAHDLEELICQDLDTYTRLAIELANDRKRLEAITEKLKANCRSVPARDTKRFVKHLELAYKEAIDKFDSGLAPDHIDVASLTSIEA